MLNLRKIHHKSCWFLKYMYIWRNIDERLRERKSTFQYLYWNYSHSCKRYLDIDFHKWWFSQTFRVYVLIYHTYLFTPISGFKANEVISQWADCYLILINKNSDFLQPSLTRLESSTRAVFYHSMWNNWKNGSFSRWSGWLFLS